MLFFSAGLMYGETVRHDMFPSSSMCYIWEVNSKVAAGPQGQGITNSRSALEADVTESDKFQSRRDRLTSDKTKHGWLVHVFYMGTYQYNCSHGPHTIKGLQTYTLFTAAKHHASMSFTQ